jgi:hypothetical protein
MALHPGHDLAGWSPRSIDRTTALNCRFVFSLRANPSARTSQQDRSKQCHGTCHQTVNTIFWCSMARIRRVSNVGKTSKHRRIHAMHPVIKIEPDSRGLTRASMKRRVE